MGPKQLPLRLGTLQKARAVWSEIRGATLDRVCRPHLLAQRDRKPATNALNLVKPMTGGGGLGKYTNVMKRKQLPLRLGTLQKACAAALSRLIEIPHRDLNASKQAVFFGGERRVRSALSV
jgi:hypothetical protein